MRAISIAYFICSILTLPASAQSVTGNDLKSSCDDPTGEKYAFCVSYVLGVTEGLRLGIAYPMFIAGDRTVEDINTLSDTLLGYCAFSTVTTAQNIAVVAKYLRDNPEQLHNPARWLVLNAYQNAYAC